MWTEQINILLMAYGNREDPSAQTLSRMLDVPFAIVDATTLTSRLRR